MDMFRDHPNLSDGEYTIGYSLRCRECCKCMVCRRAISIHVARGVVNKYAARRVVL